MREAGLESYVRRLPLGRDLLTEIRLGSTSRDPGELFGFFKLQQGSGSEVCNSSVPTSLEYNKHYLYCTVLTLTAEVIEYFNPQPVPEAQGHAVGASKES